MCRDFMRHMSGNYDVIITPRRVSVAFDTVNVIPEEFGRSSYGLCVCTEVCGLGGNQ